ncbi:MtnX-like HAD-IB family phosphatase [Candidatus Magnetaquicoccus inordinatus]|uniref:MtnX-like HAD-IB family phosphatase n=1 Tax=Candidatus Magnetaquicoccus inordinatus TaxID=2496818 RepID=UPI00102C8B4E|nr:MtnX-like HAD-IB family phosphatase [Candidatus Magnetaquicoccus inordinatus]
MSATSLPSVTCLFLCDFDGTIMPEDVSDALLSRFALPEWQEIETAWRAGTLSARDCMQQQVALLRVALCELDQFVDQRLIDPGFAPFVQQVTARGWQIRIVSDGLDYAIKRVLQRHGLADLPVFANHLQVLADGSYQLHFPNADPHCRSGSGTCKCAVAAREGGAAQVSILIGDGSSDFCLAHQVQQVWAKDRLLNYCQKQGLPHWPMPDFSAAAQRVQNGDWLSALHVSSTMRAES